MKVKINKKSYQIKPSSELTVKEYLLFWNGIDKEISSLEVLIKYLAITLNLSYKSVADIDINKTTIKRLFAFVGDIPQAQDIPEYLTFYHKKTGKTIYRNSVNWRTIGIRKLLEERKTESQLELAVYLLAVYVSDDYDHENIEKVYIELQDYRALDVFGFVLFFFKKLLPGKKQGSNFLRKLRKKVNTNTAK